MSETNPARERLAEELRRLDAQISWVTRGVAYTIALVLTVYAVWFIHIQRSDIPESGAPWGTFGDYFGGLLNPIIALTALYWLTRSVRLQKEELNETRSALERSAKEQGNQVALTSWTALINANTSQSQHLQYQLAQVKQGIADAMPKHGEMMMGHEQQHRMSMVHALEAKVHPLESELAERARIGRGYEEKLATLVQKLQDDA